MPFVTIQGVRIHYEVEGTGSPLVLQHGFTDSPVTWYETGYVDGLKQRNRLILISARGHHLSDKPHEPDAYAIECFVADTVAVLDDLGISQAHYFGYSMGGWIGFGMARYAPERVGSMILGGASPAAAAPGNSDPFRPILLQGASALLSFYEGVLSPELQARLLANDMEALIACRRKRFESPGFDEFLTGMRMPSLLFAGDADPIYAQVKECAAKMPQAIFFALAGIGHTPAFFHSELVLPHVTKFLADRQA